MYVGMLYFKAEEMYKEWYLLITVPSKWEAIYILRVPRIRAVISRRADEKHQEINCRSTTAFQNINFLDKRKFEIYGQFSYLFLRSWSEYLCRKYCVSRR